MPKYILQKSGPLHGEVKIGGAKNAALPVMAATLLTDAPCQLSHVPDLSDIRIMQDLLKSFGCQVGLLEQGGLLIETGKLKNSITPYELVSKMRASFLVMGPLLARKGKTRVSLPGGCAIGTRPVDLHLKGFQAMGAKISQGHGFVEARAKELHGANIYLDFPSDDATENILMAATLAEGETVIENAATEPEIIDLALFLTGMGAKIEGAGTDTIHIIGVPELSGAAHTIIPDRIEAGTFMTAAAITKGDVLLHDVVPDHLRPITAKLREMGVEITEFEDAIRVRATDKMKAADIKTLPYPGFPTDMQAQFASLLSLIDGTSIISETIFENRFMHVSELKRMGANIKIEGRTAIIEGEKKLTGAQVKATDLRAGAALVLAGLAAEGETEIGEIEHIERGYEGFDQKLASLGAKIEKECPQSPKDPILV